MISSSKTKILVIAVIFLLLTNIAMLAFFLFGKGPGKKDNHGGGREAMMRTFLQKDIGFTDPQLQQYDSLAKIHKESIKSSMDEVRNNREKDLKEISGSGFNDSVISTAANRSSARQKDMLEKMFLHFKDIRKLCTPDQQPKFDSLFYKIWTRKDDKHKKPGD